jgi:predicted phage tail protein
MKKNRLAGSGGGGCFVGDTLISTPDGKKPIVELQEGDLVLSFDDQGDIHEAKILKVHRHEAEEIWWYKFWGGSSFTATPNHWVLNQYNAFVEIGTLDSDDCVVNQNNHLVPLIEKKKIGLGSVYNLTVENQHTFIAENVRVHNAGLGFGITGSGGGGNKGGGGSYTPTTANDNLRSTQFARVLDLISEGEIDGIEGGLKGIYLDGTAIQSSSGTDNFVDYSFATRNGTQAQAYLGDDKAKSSSEHNVGLEVVNSTPIVKTITDRDVDRIRVTLRIPSLQEFTSKGDVLGANVSIAIHVQYNGGGYNAIVTDTINGKSSSNYLKDYMIELTGAFPVDIRFVRTSADSSTKYQNQTWFNSYTEIKDEKLTYPNSALCWLKFEASQFSSIPERRYLVRGIKVKLPSNASVDTTTHLGRVTYTGVWDGTFGAATWCADPCWCLYDLMINARYGANIPESTLDKWDFYSISQYCNELVSDGKGGQEPRFSCNYYLNSRKEIYNVIQEMSSLFRGLSYYAAGSLVLLQDKESDSQFLLGPSNVVDGRFEYSGTSHRVRHSSCTVAWQDYDTLGEVQWEQVEDADAVSKYGVINKEIRLMGCYSQGQAQRAGRWMLLSEQNLSETVSFVVSIDSGIAIRPGMIVSIADPVKAGERRSGRISSATTTTVVIDSNSDLTIDMANSPVVSVLLPTGLIEEKVITNFSGTTITIDSSSPFSETPATGAVWEVKTTTIVPQKFRVVSISEEDGGLYTVTSLKYNSTIYSAVDSKTKIQTPDISNLSVIPDVVTNITGNEYLYQDGSNILTAFDLGWTSPAGNVSEYFINYRLGSNNWTQITSLNPSATLRNLTEGTLEVQIQSINFVGGRSAIATATFTLLGKTAVPANVQNLTIEPISVNTARLTWDQTVDLDVKTGGKVHIRHSSKTDGSATWTNSVDLVAAKGGATTTTNIPLLAGEVMVKFADSGGRMSASETSIIVDPPDPIGNLGVLTRREDQDSPPFQGTKVDTFYSDEYDALVLDGDASFDAVTSVDAIGNFDFLGNVKSSGTYTFANKIDLGAAFSLDLQRRFVTRGFLPADLIDNRTALMDTWADFDGGVINNVNAILEVRTTNNDPASGGASWGAWQNFANGTFKGRGFDFRTTLTSTDVDENIIVDELGYTASLQTRTEQSTGLVASGAGTKTITFGKAFFTGTSALGGGTSAYLPSVGINVNNMASGDYIQMGTVTGTQFQVTFKNSGGSSVDRNFTWSVVGYGKGV